MKIFYKQTKLYYIILFLFYLNKIEKLCKKTYEIVIML